MSGTDVIDVAARKMHESLMKWGVTERAVTLNGKTAVYAVPANPKVIRGIEALIFDGCTLLVVSVALKVMISSFQTGWLSTGIFGLSLLGRVVAGKAVFLGDDMGDMVVQAVTAMGLQTKPPGLHPIQISRFTLLWIPELLA